LFTVQSQAIDTEHRGADSDGTLGLKAIKENGGLTMAQLPNGSGPRNPDMPQSAIASGVVDIAIPAEEMGQKLVELARGLDLNGGLDGSEWKEDEKKLDGRVRRAVDGTNKVILC
jgi:two-component system CheB/CheR fusion protein